MNILVLTSGNVIDGELRTIPDWDAVSALGHEVCFYDTGEEPDFIVCMTVLKMEEAWSLIDKYPNSCLMCYHWDCYEWVWNNPRKGEYDYSRWGDLLKRSDVVLTPSECTRVRAKQWWNVDSKVVLASVPYWDYADIQDKGYALCALREIPDPQWGMFERCCDELGIPYLMSGHEQTQEDYRRLVAHCRFLVSPLYELSTGGLTLIEGYYLGKPCLLSDSIWHGGKDYMGDRATYFRADSERDFKEHLELMYTKPPTIEPDHAEWVTSNYSDARMADDLNSYFC